MISGKNRALRGRSGAKEAGPEESGRKRVTLRLLPEGDSFPLNTPKIAAALPHRAALRLADGPDGAFTISRARVRSCPEIIRGGDSVMQSHAKA